MDSNEINDMIEYYAKLLSSGHDRQKILGEARKIFSTDYAVNEYGDRVMEEIIEACDGSEPEVERFSTLYLDERPINKIVYHEDNHFEHSLVLRNGEVYQNKRSVLACDETPIAINRQQVCKLIEALEKVLELDLVND